LQAYRRYFAQLYFEKHMNSTVLFATMPRVIASTQTMTLQGDFPCSFPLHGVDKIAWGGANFSLRALGGIWFSHAMAAF